MEVVPCTNRVRYHTWIESKATVRDERRFRFQHFKSYNACRTARAESRKAHNSCFSTIHDRRRQIEDRLVTTSLVRVNQDVIKGPCQNIIGTMGPGLELELGAICGFGQGLGAVGGMNDLLNVIISAAVLAR